jgi:hypothetical protein
MLLAERWAGGRAGGIRPRGRPLHSRSRSRPPAKREYEYFTLILHFVYFFTYSISASAISVMPVYTVKLALVSLGL